MNRAADGAFEVPELVPLLADLDRDPLELIEALRDARSRAAANDESLQRDLCRAELRFLESRVASRRYGAEFAASFARARQAAREAEFESLAAASLGSCAAIFDLAELGAAAAVDGDTARERGIRAELDRRIASLGEIDEALREEGRERYVAWSTKSDDAGLPARIAMLEWAEHVFAAVGERLGDKPFRRFGRRIGRLRCDRVLQLRLERWLTRQGAIALETTSLLLLFVVLALLLVEAMFDLSTSTRTTIQIVDASICVFFIAEFLFKLSLAPARVSWFLRNALTDLLPAIPAALYFALPQSPVATAGEATLFRVLRVLRVTWFARYIQALRPALRLFRLLLFMAKGLDAVVHRFAPLLNRNFVFFEEAVMPRGARSSERSARALAFRALRREHVLLRDLSARDADAVLRVRADDVVASIEALPIEVRTDVRRTNSGGEARDVPVEHAIEELYAVRPEEIGTLMPRHDIRAIDRVVRVLNAPLITSLPIIRWFRLRRGHAGSPEQRIVEFGRRVAALLERWRERVLVLADIQGIVTGPQILDRIATAMVKASFRPARNLILFGLFFLLVRVLVGEGSAVGQFLQRFVATPVLVLGSVCAVVLGLGFWLKRIAGEASDQFKLTSEASFIGLLELGKRRAQDDDLEFVARRVFRWDMEPWTAAAAIGRHVRAARTGVGAEPVEPPPAGLDDELHRTALLYLHFLDGAVLHGSDVTTSEQLLANLSLANIRSEFLGHGRRERRRLRKLSLQSGALFGGPYVWFRCITESVAVETAKRVTDYNRNCLTKARRAVATPEQRQRFAAWLRLRRARRADRLEHVAVPSRGAKFVTTEFNALDFLSGDPLRERHIERVFGRHVLRLVQRDRRTMIRELFGTRPLHLLPRSERTLNFYAYYRRRLSGGRVFLAPLHVAWLGLRSARVGFAKTVEIVREILAPQSARAKRVSGVAPFAVALRKIHRMKAPTLLEAMRLRVQFDPTYCGAPPGWSSGHGFDEIPEFERDMDFLGMHERDREEMREFAATNVRRIEELHGIVQGLEGVFDEGDEELRRHGERAVTIEFMTDRRSVRTLLRASRWLETELPRMESRETYLPAVRLRRAFAWVRRGFRRHPVDVFVDERVGDRSVSRRGRANFKRAWHAGDPVVRGTIRAWSALPAGAVPADVGVERLREAYRSRDEISREITALRTVQTLSVLDVRNYRRAVFELGRYADDGEPQALAEALP